MKGFLKTAVPIIAVVVVLLGVGISIEWFRRRSIAKWAQEQGGAFEAGGILDGVAVPEAAPFDAAGANITYGNVTRIPRPEASYVVTQYHRTRMNTKNESKSFSCVVCFVTLPSADLPPVHVSFKSSMGKPGSFLGRPEPAAPLAVPESTPSFGERFEVTALSGAGEIKPEAIARLLPKEVQDELVASGDLISGVQVRGNVVRLQAISKQFGYPHEEVFKVAQRLAAEWTSKR